MSLVTDTWVTAPRRVVSENAQHACIVQIYPTGHGMGQRFPLTNFSLTFGRDKECEVQLTDNSVSRKHARIEHTEEGFQLIDLGSTNGTMINDQLTKLSPLADGDYIRVGNCIFRFLEGGNIEAEYHEEIYRLTILDGLTGIHNKRYLLEFLDRELARSARHQRPLSLIMVDVDEFKSVNDRFGHLGGDYTLREMVSCVRHTVRREELFARYGGEEFAIVLPETTLEGARVAAERIRTHVAQHRFNFDDQAFQITVSLGVFTTAGDESLAPAELIRQADQKLYLAKHAGRNCVVA
jgi:diguanylate cyclase (GGDEF)-like protein